MDELSFLFRNFIRKSLLLGPFIGISEDEWESLYEYDDGDELLKDEQTGTGSPNL